MSSVSPQRRIAKARRRQLRAGSVRSAVRTALRGAEELINSTDKDQAKAVVARAVIALDKAASKGVLHPNNAARHKSRLLKRLNQALVSSA